MTMVYRESSPPEGQIVIVRPRHSKARINNGVLRRQVPCPVPGGFSMWWHNIRAGDVWECACGQAWRRTDWITDPWRKVPVLPEGSDT